MLRAGLCTAAGGGDASGGLALATFVRLGLLPVAVLTVGFSLALGSALSLALEPYPDAGTAAAVFGQFQMSGSALIATLLLGQGHEPAAGHGAGRALLAGPLLCASGWIARSVSRHG